MLERFKNQPTTNGWIYFGPSVANWGTDYVLRALCNMLGPGWNLPADAVYPASEKAPDGKDYDGNNKYIIHFEKGQMPPVNGFWSLTMYDADRFFVPNALNRYTLSQRDKSRRERRRLSKHLSPSRFARQGQRGELAARSERRNSASCCAFTGPRRRRLRSLTEHGGRLLFTPRVIDQSNAYSTPCACTNPSDDFRCGHETD